MDSAVVIAIAGLVTTAATAGAVPLVQASIVNKAAAAGRVHERQLADQAAVREQQLAAYVAASAHVDAIQEQLYELTTPVEMQSGPRRIVPPVGSITGQLRLVADGSLFKDWRNLIIAYDQLTFQLGEEGPTGEHGEYYCDRDDADVVRVQAALEAVTNSLRKAVGVKEFGEFDGH